MAKYTLRCLTRQSCKCLAFVKWWEFFSLLGNSGCHVSLLILLSSLSEPKSTVNCKNSDCEIALITNKQLGGQFFEGASLSSKSKPKVDLSLFIS